MANPISADNFWVQSVIKEGRAQMMHQEKYNLVNQQNIGELYK